MALDSAITRNPTYAWAYMAMATVHFERGDLALARAAVGMARRLHPSFSLASAGRVFPFKVAEHRQRHVNALRACGVPSEEGLPFASATALRDASEDRQPAVVSPDARRK